MTWETVPLAYIARVDARTVQPADIDQDTPYVGLEHIGAAGRLDLTQTAGVANLKSAKNRFDGRHVLFGKLRPNLGKVARPRVQGVSSTDIYPLPPLTEQRRIAAILDEADALRDRMRWKLLALAALEQAQYERVFGSVSPESSLRDLLDRIESGVSPVCEARPASDGEWGVLKLGAVTTGTYLAAENKAITPEYEPRTSLAVRRGDVLMSRKNTLEHVGASVFVSATPARRLLPDLVFRLVPNDLSIRRALQAYLALPGTRRVLSALAGGSASSMANISKARLLTLAAPRFTASLVERITSIASEIEVTRTGISQAYARTDALFASLQHRAFRGEL